jgi:predicted XRE-type DNA-binding protein
MYIEESTFRLTHGNSRVHLVKMIELLQDSLGPQDRMTILVEVVRHGEGELLDDNVMNIFDDLMTEYSMDQKGIADLMVVQQPTISRYRSGKLAMPAGFARALIKKMKLEGTPFEARLLNVASEDVRYRMRAKR